MVWCCQKANPCRKKGIQKNSYGKKEKKKKEENVAEDTKAADKLKQRGQADLSKYRPEEQSLLEMRNTSQVYSPQGEKLQKI